MTNLPPAQVLAKRLESHLRTMQLVYEVPNPSTSGLRFHIEKAQDLLAQLQEAMR